MCHTQWTAWLNFSLGSGPTECQSHREPRALPLASPSYVQRENQKSRKALRLRGPQHLSPALDPPSPPCWAPELGTRPGPLPGTDTPIPFPPLKRGRWGGGEVEEEA